MIDCLLHNTLNNQAAKVDVFIHKNEHLQLKDQSILGKFRPVTTHSTFIMSVMPLVTAINFNDIQTTSDHRRWAGREQGARVNLKVNIQEPPLNNCHISMFSSK